MSLGTSGVFNLPKRQQNYRVPLTPLADAMFQLLIFFMLSSSLAPFSLLTLKSAPESLETGESQSATGEGDGPSTDTVVGTIWTVEPGLVRVGGQPFEFDALPALAEALTDSGVTQGVTVIIRARTTVQDVTLVLEALRAAGIEGIQITTGAI